MLLIKEIRQLNLGYFKNENNKIFFVFDFIKGSFNNIILKRNEIKFFLGFLITKKIKKENIRVF